MGRVWRSQNLAQGANRHKISVAVCQSVQSPFHKPARFGDRRLPIITHGGIPVDELAAIKGSHDDELITPISNRVQISIIVRC